MVDLAHGARGLAVVVAVASLGALAPAAAHADVTLRVAGATPFSRAELEDALRLRLGPRHAVAVAATGAGLTVTVDGRSRSLVLGVERGAAAARLVALVAASLALDGPPDAAEVPTRLDAGLSASPAEGPAAVPRGWARWIVGALVAAPAGAHTRSGGGVALGLERGGDVQVTLMIGLERRVAEVGTAPAVRTLGVPVRAGLGVGGRLAVGAAAVAMPYATSGGAGDRGVVVGGGVTARAVVPAPGEVELVVQVGLDVMASQVVYRWADETVLTTGRLRPWLVIGATWEGGP